MHIMVIGLRGLPGVQGGVENHAKNLYPLLVKLGCEVTVVVRSRYMPRNIGKDWQGVRLLHLWAPCPGIPGLEAFLHTFFGVIYASLKRPDVLHIHAIGPAIMTPLAYIFGLRTVVTHHGTDYDREKWGACAKFLLRLGERFGMRFATSRIVISRAIQNLIRSKYNRDSELIPNGVNLPDVPTGINTLKEFGLERNRYVMLVGRFVPEKRHLDLIDAFIEADLPNWKLVLVGSLTPADEYIQKIMTCSQKTPNLVLTDFQYGSALAELYANAGIFALPSSHEGLPIVMLEALSHGLPVVASDIVANLEIGLPAEHYFPLGDVKALAGRLREFAAWMSSNHQSHQKSNVQSWVQALYDWEKISIRTMNVYSCIARNKRMRPCIETEQGPS